MAADGNIIANNGGAGVNVLDPSDSGLNVGNAILSNSIYGNAALGIDLGGNGVTMNHSGGLITGSQRVPELSGPLIGGDVGVTDHDQRHAQRRRQRDIHDPVLLECDGRSVGLRPGADLPGFNFGDDEFQR